jgi:hypothetical protein
MNRQLNLKFLFSVFSLFGLLAGCSTAKSISLPDGRTGFLIQCGGTMNSWATCVEKVSEVCGAQGYEIVSKNEEEGIANLMGSITPTIARDMIAVCGAPKKIEKTGNSRNRDETI